MRVFLLICSLLTTVAPTHAVATCAETTADSPVHVSLLAQHGIEPDVESIRVYLRSLHPGSDAWKTAAVLIERLGDDDFYQRERAMSELIRMPVIAPEQLRQVEKDDDPEVRWRASHVLGLVGPRNDKILHAVFQVVQSKELKGLAPSVLACMPLCSQDSVRLAARQALAVTAVAADADLLRRVLSGDDVHLRIAAVGALAALLGEKANSDLLPLLNDADAQVCMEIAEVLADAGNREALPALGRLLASEDVKIRTRSARLLRTVTGKRFKYAAYVPAEKRAEATKAWQAWIAREGKTAKLMSAKRETPVTLGRTLICYHSSNRVIELDAQGNQVWQQQVTKPWGCQGLPNGNRLIASHGSHTVVEYDASGEQVWAKADLPGPPFKVRLLKNGNILVACSESSKVLEIKRDTEGSIVWEATLPGQPIDARRLENGLTLVALQNESRVVEVDRAGKIVWSIENMSNPLSVERLENGNTLVCQQDAGAVRELDRKGDVVWEQTGFTRPSDIQRLPNGNTLIVDAQSVKEIDLDGEVKWERPGSNPSGVCRY